jgi:hypothetical protein
MISVKIYYNNGNTNSTDINATFEEAQNYYVGNVFNIGTGADGTPEDNLQRCIKIELLKSYEQEQYEKGFSLAAEGYTHFSIAYNGTWSAAGKEAKTATSTTTATISAYEKIGHHRGTIELMKGVAESGIKIIDYRINTEAVKEGFGKLSLHPFNVWLMKDQHGYYIANNFMHDLTPNKRYLVKDGHIQDETQAVQFANEGNF